VIVIDTSALIAILSQEPPKSHLVAKIEAATPRIISPVTRVETVMVASRMFPQPIEAVNALLRTLEIETVPIDISQSELAAKAFIDYGKGRHPARLNCGDCFAYAAAKALNAPLLYVGDDFGKTDIRAA